MDLTGLKAPWQNSRVSGEISLWLLCCRKQWVLVPQLKRDFLSISSILEPKTRNPSKGWFLLCGCSWKANPYFVEWNRPPRVTEWPQAIHSGMWMCMSIMWSWSGNSIIPSKDNFKCLVLFKSVIRWPFLIYGTVIKCLRSLALTFVYFRQHLFLKKKSWIIVF